MPDARAAIPEYLPLLGGLVVLLTASSIAGWLLSWRAQGATVSVRNFMARVNAWWVMVAMMAAAFLLGSNATLVAFGLMSYLALREFVTLTSNHVVDRLSLSVAFFLVLPGQYVLIGTDHYGLFSIFIPVCAFLLVPAVAALRGGVVEFLPRIANLQWGLMITVYALSHVPALLLLNIKGFEGRNALLLIYLLFVVQISDVLQYVCGKLWGHTKIAPVASPSKTAEGFVGGGLGAIAAGAAMWWITPFSPLQSAAVAAIIVVMGFLGGLTLSAVKRSLGAKDWGVMISGHGGMLDRVDSVCFAAPVFFHLTRLYYGL